MKQRNLFNFFFVENYTSHQLDIGLIYILVISNKIWDNIHTISSQGPCKTPEWCYNLDCLDLDQPAGREDPGQHRRILHRTVRRGGQKVNIQHMRAKVLTVHWLSYRQNTCFSLSKPRHYSWHICHPNNHRHSIPEYRYIQERIEMTESVRNGPLHWYVRVLYNWN